VLCLTRESKGTPRGRAKVSYMAVFPSVTLGAISCVGERPQWCAREKRLTRRQSATLIAYCVRGMRQAMQSECCLNARRFSHMQITRIKLSDFHKCLPVEYLPHASMQVHTRHATDFRPRSALV